MKILALNYLKFGHSDQEKLLRSFLTKHDGFKFALKCDPKWSNHILLERICLLGPPEINFTFSYKWFTQVFQRLFVGIWFSRLNVTMRAYSNVHVMKYVQSICFS